MWHRLLMGVARGYLAAQARRRPPLPLAGLNLKQVQRVLLISATGLGDTLFSTPALRALKERFPDWRLEVLGHQHYGALLQHNPYLERLWSYPGRSPRLLGLARDLRRRHYDLVIILHGNDPEATWLAHATGSPYLLGSARSPLSFVYGASVGASDPYRHAIERRLDFVRLLGADASRKRMDLFLPEEERKRAADILSLHFGEAPPLLLAFHPTGSDPYKWWPAESFAELGNFLYETYQAPLLIISGRSDRAAAEALAAQLSGPTLVTAGRYSLLTVAALLSRCRLFVGGDSGPLHMALALGVPSIALMGADDPRRVGPYQVEWGAWLHKRPEVCQVEPCLLKKCPDNRCLTAIQVSEVVELIKTWWEPRYLKG